MKKLLWTTLVLFTFETIAIIGANWVTGYLGDGTLTLSRYIGLNLWSIIAFGVINFSIIILLTIYATKQKLGIFLLMMFFNICYLTISLCPHVPYESPVVSIHQIFAIALFIIMLLIGVLLYNNSSKLPRLLTGIFILFGLHFFFAYANHLPYFMNGILYWEIAYIYLFFIALLANNTKNR